MAVPRPDFEEVVVDPAPLGGYVLLDPIARGRTGTVHRACALGGTPDELLVIKRISPELSSDRDVAERFMEVVGRAAQLEHPAHCAILDLEQTADGSLYVAMELVAGKDLGRVVAQLEEIGRAMPPQLVAHVGAQIADVLEAAHRMTHDGRPAPLHHGELSLADILIGYDGRVRLTGLGTAELALAAPRARYRAPELARGGPCNAQSDVFSLGACLYEVLAGRPAEVADPRAAASHRRRRPESHITKVIPRSLEQIVGRALAEQPAARWQSAAELGRALQRWSAAQPGRSDASALAMFMISIFDAAIADEDKRLRAWLAQAAHLQPAASHAPSASPALSGIAPAPRGDAMPMPARNSYARLVRASARPVPSTQLQDWDDPTDHTPPRGLLMRKLAADMVDDTAAYERPAEEPAIDVVDGAGDDAGWEEPAAAEEPSATQPSSPPPSAPQPRASASSPPHPAAGLAFGDLLSDESWDDESPVSGWIAESEERAHGVPLRAPASNAPASNAPPSNAPPSNASPSNASPSNAPPRLPPMPKRAVGSAAPSSARPVSTRPASARPTPAQPAPQRSAPPLAFPAPAPVPVPMRAAPMRPRRPRWLAPVLGVGTLALVVAAIVALRGAGSELSTLHVSTRPSGAEVFVRGERLGTAPLMRSDLTSGSAALELRAPGFEPAVRTIQLERGKAVYLDVDLIRRTERAAAAPSTAASREADLQAQLAAARLAPQSAEAAAPDDSTRDGEAQRRRRASAGERSLPDEPEASASPAAPAVAPTASAATVLELKPAPAAEPAPVAATPAPTQPKPAAKPAAPAPAPAAGRESRSATRAPVLLEQVAPRFPARARRMGITAGVVSIEFTINAAGAVRDALVVKADPPGLFDEAALRAIERWRYSPKLEGGTPVATRQRFTIRFQD